MGKLKLICCILVAIISNVGCVNNGNTVAKGSIDEYHLIFSMQNAVNSPTHFGMIAFAEKLAELSDGTMTVNINLIQTINSIEDLIEPLINGEHDIALTGYAYADLAYKIPQLEIIGQAYIFRDYEHFLTFRESDYGKKIRESFHKIGIINTKAWYFGVRHITSNNPITSLANLRGLRLRVPPIDSSTDFAEAMGAIPFPIGFGGFYDALKNKFIDGQENPLSIIESAKIHEVQECIAMTSHSISLAVPLVNKKLYDSFSEQQEAWFEEAMEHARQVCYNLSIEEEAYLLEKFQNEYGMKITYPDIEEFKAAMKPYYDELEKKYGEGSVYDIINMK